MVRFAKGDRKADVMRPYLQAATGPGVVAIGMVQEFQSGFAGYDHNADQPGPLSRKCRSGHIRGYARALRPAAR